MKMNYFIIILLFFLLSYFFIVVLVYIFQRNLLYHPSENNYYGDDLLVSIERVKIKTQDDIELLSWYHNKDINNYKTILFFHGNAGSLENRIHKINHFKNMDVNFLLIAWRGFSGNEGQPTEEGLYEDARSAISWLKSKGVKVNQENFMISESANLILPFHREMDEIREDAAGKAKIGTTRRGIGPAYEDKVGRRSIRVMDLVS